MKIDLSIIMCSFNEEAWIQKSLNDLHQSIDSRSESVEILLIDNGSNDGTRDVIKKIKDPRYRIFFNDKNIGKGGSIKKGIQNSTGKYIVIHDPDFEYRASDLWRCYDSITSQPVECILGSRLKGSKIRFIYLTNLLGVIFLSKLISWLYNCEISDGATAMKMFHASTLKNLQLASSGFDLDFELITKTRLAKGSIGEIAIEYFPRTFKEGKKIRALQDGIKALFVILRDRYQFFQRISYRFYPSAN
ncbi:MAG: glycosyltransferase family 2 protein [Deltaproteobacteria bacterium]|nr:glycosyltransferase family 2 protein [Deltaproteobacteria bacterium]